jgi:hypothetical protein
MNLIKTMRGVINKLFDLDYKNVLDTVHFYLHIITGFTKQYTNNISIKLENYNMLD